MLWLPFFLVPQIGAGEEGEQTRSSCAAWTQDWERRCCTRQSCLGSRVLPPEPFPPPPRCPILSTDIDLELESGRWTGLWWRICSASWQNKPVRTKLKHKVKAMAVFNEFLYHCTLRHDTKHHTTPLPTHRAEQKSLFPFSLHKSQALMLSQGTTKTKQELMPRWQKWVQKWVFLALVSLAEQSWLWRGSYKVTAKSIKSQGLKKGEGEGTELNSWHKA